MAFSYKNKKSGQEYFLHGKVTTLRGGRQQQIYWFAKAIDKATCLDEVPADRMVFENENTGLPLLKKKA